MNGSWISISPSNWNDFPLPNGVSSDECFNHCRSLGKGDVHELDHNNDLDGCQEDWG